MERSLFLQTYSPSQQCETSTASNSKTSRKHRGLTSRKVRNVRGGRADCQLSCHSIIFSFHPLPLYSISGGSPYCSLIQIRKFKPALFVYCFCKSSALPKSYSQQPHLQVQRYIFFFFFAFGNSETGKARTLSYYQKSSVKHTVNIPCSKRLKQPLEMMAKMAYG